MKAVLITLSLFVFFKMGAQDGYNQSREHYMSIQALTQDLTKDEACDLADLLISNVGYDYSFWRISETSTSLTYIFTLKKAVMNRNEVNLLTIEFRKTATGFDFADLKVFSETADAIYVWSRVFLPGSSWDMIRANYKYRDLISPDGKVKIRLLHGDQIKKFQTDRKSKFE
ncbi:hypothetical protein EI546_06620 [Aequorivita sp. H23M31]|uniref:Uncharacterized protein n=1 Tax=Aequorivita ciconiae TaxID=2494375 RepID=A0A410G2E8_9FLAO|nr:hypothetical protein [Aequorivita sp. H23M31]QAA81423.1 hypothetical protein EI546_06620 [Aequorivita sp. H23M31]